MWPMQAEAFSRVSEEDPEVKRQVKSMRVVTRQFEKFCIRLLPRNVLPGSA